MADAPALELAEIAASSGSLTERAQWMLDRLRQVAPFDAAWLALADPLGGQYGPYRSLLAVDLDADAEEFLAGPRNAADIETTQTNRRRPPLSPSDLPFPVEDLETWSECLIPAGYHEALATGLFTSDNRHVGFLALLSGDTRPPTATVRRQLSELAPILARGIDPLRALAASARVFDGAIAGAALCRDGTPRPLPGLGSDRLLAESSPVTALACAYLADEQVFGSFLWPRADLAGPDEYVRVTVIGSPAEAPAGLLGAVVLAPASGDLHGLTPRELEVLGLVIEGLTNQQIARALVVTVRTVATHLEHILVKLDASTRTLAAVRAERRGLYVPSFPIR